MPYELEIPELSPGALLLDGGGLSRVDGLPVEGVVAGAAPIQRARFACDAAALYIALTGEGVGPKTAVALTIRPGGTNQACSLGWRLVPPDRVRPRRGSGASPGISLRCHGDTMELAVPRSAFRGSDSLVMEVEVRQPHRPAGYSPPIKLRLPRGSEGDHEHYALADRRDARGAARIFPAAFGETMQHVFGKRPPQGLVNQVFLLLHRADPDAFLVAKRGDRVVGYVFAPADLKVVWRTAVSGGYLWHWFFNWITGRYRLGWAPLGVILRDKFHFLRSAVAEEDATSARILSVAVAQEARGGGVGTHLVRHALERFRRLHIDRVRLEVRPWNEAAKAIYEGLGFEVIATTQDSQGDWLVMVKALTSSRA